ncbi:MAG: hypothetical protein ACLTL6_00600 [Holdemanella porci]
MNIDNVSMLCDVGVLKPTKIGRAYMFSQGMLLKFQHDYEGLNVCNRLRALESKKIVEQRGENNERETFTEHISHSSY